MTDFKKNKKTYFLATVFLGLVLATIFLVVTPLINQIKKSGGELAQNRQTTKTFFQNWQNLKKSQQEIEKKKNDLGQGQFILSKNDAIKFIKSLENIAAKTDNAQKISVVNALTSIKSSGQEEKQDNLIDFQVSLKGGFQNLMKFLINLEGLSYSSEIKSINIGKASEAQELGTLINLSILTN